MLRWTEIALRRRPGRKSLVLTLLPRTRKLKLVVA